MFKKWKGKSKKVIENKSHQTESSFEESNPFAEDERLSIAPVIIKDDKSIKETQNSIIDTSSVSNSIPESKFVVALKEYRALKLNANGTHNMNNEYAQAARSVLYEGIQEARQYLRAEKLSNVVNEVLKRRSQTQSYSSTQELSVAYNEANIFDRHKHFNGKLIHPEQKELILNKQRGYLITVARSVIECYCQRHHPNPQEIMEISNLAAFDHQEVNEKILNSILMPLQEQLKDKSLLILDQHLVEGLTTMVRALPSHFLEANLEALLLWVEALAKWVNDRMNKGGSEDKCRIVLKNMCSLLDAIADNSLMQTLSQNQNESVLSYLKKNIQLEVNPSTSQMKQVISSGIKDGVSGIGKIAKSYLENGIASIKNLNPEEFVSQKSGNGGIAQENKNFLKMVLLKYKNHSDDEIKYYILYCEQALARIVGDEEASQGQLMFKRGLHLLAGAKSVASIVLSQGLALHEYSQAITHLKHAFTNPIIAKQGWYQLARELDSLLSGSCYGEVERFHAVLDSIEVIVQTNRKIQPLQLCILMSLRKLLSMSENQGLQQRIIGLVMMLYEDVSDCHTEKAPLLTILYIWSQSNNAHLNQLSKQILKQIQANDHHYWRSEKGSKMIHNQLQIPRNIDAIQPNPSRYVLFQSPIPSSIQLLSEARQRAFPIEYMIFRTRKQVEKIRLETGVDNDLKVYVPLDGSPNKNSKETFELNSKIFEFIEHPDDKVLLLHGQAGSGKSLFGRYLERSLWAYYDFGGVVPLVINLNSLTEPNHHAIEQALSDYGWPKQVIDSFKDEKGSEIERDEKDTQIVSKRRKSVLNGSDSDDGPRYRQKVKMPRLVIFLDGYDEIRTRENLYQSNKLFEWNAKVIISVRTEYLDSLGSDYLYSFTGSPSSSSSSSLVDHNLKSGKTNKEISKTNKSSVLEVFIKPFTSDQIVLYLQNIARKKKAFFKEEQHRLLLLSPASSLRSDGSGTTLITDLWDASQYQAAIDSVPGIAELIQHPFILQIITEVLPTLKKLQDESVVKKKVSRADVYELFIDQWFDREARRVTQQFQSSLQGSGSLPEGLQLKASFWEYALAVASFMYDKKVAAVKAPSPNYSRYEVSLEEGAHFFKEDDIKSQIARKGVPLKRAGVNVFGFIHKSILEYFVAKGIHEDVMMAAQENEPLNPMSVFNNRLIQEEPSVAKFVSEMLCKREKDRQALLSIVKLSRPLTWYEKVSFDDNIANQVFSGTLGVGDDDDVKLHKLMTLKDKRNDQSIVRAAANAMTVLVIDRFTFSQLDLSHVRISHAILDFGLFYGVNFSNANLTKVSARSAILSETNLDGCDLTDIDFGEPNSIELDRLDTDVGFTQMVFTSDGSKFVTSNIHGTIELWTSGFGNIVSPPEKLACFHGYVNTIVKFAPCSIQLKGCQKDTKADMSMSLVALGLTNGRIGVWDYLRGELIYSLSLPPSKCMGIDQKVQELCWSADGLLLFSFHGTYHDEKQEPQYMLIWDMVTGEIKLNSKPIENISIDPELDGIKGLARYALVTNNDMSCSQVLLIHETDYNKKTFSAPMLYNIETNAISSLDNIDMLEEEEKFLYSEKLKINPYHISCSETGQYFIVQFGEYNENKPCPIPIAIFSIHNKRMIKNIDNVMVNKYGKAQCLLTKSGNFLITSHGQFSFSNSANHDVQIWKLSSTTAKTMKPSAICNIENVCSSETSTQFQLSPDQTLLITIHSLETKKNTEESDEDEEEEYPPKLLKVWKLETGELQFQVDCVSVNIDGRAQHQSKQNTLITMHGPYDDETPTPREQAKVWDLITGKETSQKSQIQDIATNDMGNSLYELSSNGQVLITFHAKKGEKVSQPKSLSAWGIDHHGDASLLFQLKESIQPDRFGNMEYQLSYDGLCLLISDTKNKQQKTKTLKQFNLIPEGKNQKNICANFSSVERIVLTANDTWRCDCYCYFVSLLNLISLGDPLFLFVVLQTKNTSPSRVHMSCSENVICINSLSEKSQSTHEFLKNMVSTELTSSDEDVRIDPDHDKNYFMLPSDAVSFSCLTKPMVGTFSKDRIIRVWSNDGAKLTPASLPLTGVDEIVYLKFNSGNNKLWFASLKGFLYEWEYINQESISSISKGHHSEITFLKLTKDSQAILSYSDLDRCLCVWDANTGDMRFTSPNIALKHNTKDEPLFKLVYHESLLIVLFDDQENMKSKGNEIECQFKSLAIYNINTGVKIPISMDGSDCSMIVNIAADDEFEPLYCFSDISLSLITLHPSLMKNSARYDDLHYKLSVWKMNSENNSLLFCYCVNDVSMFFSKPLYSLSGDGKFLFTFHGEDRNSKELKMWSLNHYQRSNKTDTNHSKPQKSIKNVTTNKFMKTLFCHQNGCRFIISFHGAYDFAAPSPQSMQVWNCIEQNGEEMSFSLVTTVKDIVVTPSKNEEAKQYQPQHLVIEATAAHGTTSVLDKLLVITCHPNFGENKPSNVDVDLDEPSSYHWNAPKTIYIHTLKTHNDEQGEGSLDGESYHCSNPIENVLVSPPIKQNDVYQGDIQYRLCANNLTLITVHAELGMDHCEYSNLPELQAMWGEPKSISLWDVTTGSRIGQSIRSVLVEKNKEGKVQYEVSPAGDALLTLHETKSPVVARACVWDTVTGEKKFEYESLALTTITKKVRYSWVSMNSQSSCLIFHVVNESNPGLVNLQLVDDQTGVLLCPPIQHVVITDDTVQFQFLYQENVLITINSEQQTTLNKKKQFLRLWDLSARGIMLGVPIPQYSDQMEWKKYCSQSKYRLNKDRTILVTLHGDEAWLKPKTVCVWNLQTGNMVLSNPIEDVIELKPGTHFKLLGPDLNILLTSKGVRYHPETISLWNLETGELLIEPIDNVVLDMYGSGRYYHPMLMPTYLGVDDEALLRTNKSDENEIANMNVFMAVCGKQAKQHLEAPQTIQLIDLENGVSFINHPLDSVLVSLNKYFNGSKGAAQCIISRDASLLVSIHTDFTIRCWKIQNICHKGGTNDAQEEEVQQNDSADSPGDVNQSRCCLQLLWIAGTYHMEARGVFGSVANVSEENRNILRSKRALLSDASSLTDPSASITNSVASDSAVQSSSLTTSSTSTAPSFDVVLSSMNQMLALMGQLDAKLNSFGTQVNDIQHKMTLLEANQLQSAGGGGGNIRASSVSKRPSPITGSRDRERRVSSEAPLKPRHSQSHLAKKH